MEGEGVSTLVGFLDMFRWRTLEGGGGRFVLHSHNIHVSQRTRRLSSPLVGVIYPFPGSAQVDRAVMQLRGIYYIGSRTHADAVPI